MLCKFQEFLETHPVYSMLLIIAIPLVFLLVVSMELL